MEQQKTIQRNAGGNEEVSKLALILITFFFGGIGGHKFYLHKNLQGALYLLFFWTGIPSLIAIFELIIYAVTSEDKLRAKYSARGKRFIIVLACIMGSFMLLAFAGIIAAIVVPTYMAHKERAAIQSTLKKQPAKSKAAPPKPLQQKPAPKKQPQDLAAREGVISELHTLLSLQYAFYTENGRYASDPADLGGVANPDIRLTIIQADVNCFQAEGIHTRMQAPLRINCRGLQ